MQSKTTISCADGVALNAAVYSPEQSITKTHATVIVAAALGVPQTFYSDFASFCSLQGIRCLTFDYRGSYTEKPYDNNRAANFRLSEWGTQDISAAIDYCKQCPEPIHLIGHSIGGQVVSLAKNTEQLESIILVAASAPYWRRWQFPRNILMFLSGHFLFPLVTRLSKFFNSRKFGLGTMIIQAQLLRDWALWMRQPDYLFSNKLNLDTSAVRHLKCPIFSYLISDDNLAPEANIHHLNQWFNTSNLKLIRIDPKDLQAKFIGHSGLFRKKVGGSYWLTMLSHMTENKNTK